MSSDQTKGPSWKNPGSGGNRPVHASRKQWQSGGKPATSGPADPRARFRKRLFGAGLTGSLLIAGVVIVVWLWKPPKQPALVLAAPETNSTLSVPSTIYASNAAKALAEWAGQGKDRPRLFGDGKVIPREGWHRAILFSTKEKSLIVCFAANGAADKNGPYLWMTPGDAVTIDDSQKLPVKEILQRLAELPADKEKLVIFDAAQVPASWAHGYLHNDFARALKSLDAEIEKVPNLVVICSSDDDQRSWSSEEWRQTVFGHFLNEGIRGGAGKDHPRVSAAVLHDYLKREVGNWARANRDAEQTPILLPTQSGKDRAEKLEIVSIDPGNYQAPTAASAPGGNFAIPADLKTAWETAEKLGQRSPPPETAAPSVWRTYLDTLLRWEYLVRAGADADAVQRQAEALQRELQQGLFDTDPPCLPNSLAVGPALGVASTEFDSARFREIWNPLPGKKSEDVWKELQAMVRAKEGEHGVTLLRLQAARKVLDFVQQPENGPTLENLERAAGVLAVIDESQPRPIEAHFLLMLQRDLDGKQRPDRSILLKAIQLRIEAERVAWLAGAKDGYSYADQAYRWVDQPLRKADRERQLGEDLLFAVDKVSWGKAAEALKNAEADYAQCAIDAQTASDGLRIRDRVLSRLPYYARWLAGYRGSLPDGEVERLLKLIEKMASDTHQLAEKLDDVPAEAKLRLGEVKNLTSGLQAELKELQRVFDAESGGLTGVVLPSNWHAIDNALTVPFLPVDRRMKLLTEMRAISRQLLEKGQAQNVAAQPAPFNAKEQAQRQGRMALAMLGDRWVEDADARGRAPRGAALFHYGDLKQRIAQPNVGSWWDSLREAGDQIGWHFREMVPSINADLDEANQAALNQVPQRIARAAYLTRLLDSATQLPRDRSPLGEQRRYWMHELFLWQARRTAADGWAALTSGPTTRPYCVEAGERYVQAAEKLILGNNPNFESSERNRRLADVKSTAALLKAPEFTLNWSRIEDRTDDRDWQIDYRVAPASGLAVGIPMLRINQPKSPLKIADASLLSRLPIPDFSEGKPSVEKRIYLAFDKQRNDPVAGSTSVDLLYRGRICEMTTRFTLMDKPDVEWVHVPPVGKARFAIAGSKDLQQGAVTLIVDRTLSMKDPVEIEDARGKITKGPRKIEEVIKSIEEVLDQLPADTMLSIGTFHGNNDGQIKFQWLTEQPIRWNETVVQKKDIFAKVRTINPPDDAQTTPLARMMVDLIGGKLGEAFPKKFAGFRSIVVLTDGDDNISADAKEPNKPGRLVTTALKESDNDIALHMILFGCSKQEDANARRQFAPIEDPDNFDKLYRTPGKIWSSVQLRKDLVDALRESMLPKVQIVRGIENGQRLPKGLPISLPGERFLRFSPPLDAGTYQLRALGTRKLLHLEPGDRVLLEMRYDDGRMDLHIPLYADILNHIPDNLRTDSTDKRVHLTLTKNSLTDTGSSNDLQMVATLERKTQGRVEELRVDRPWFTWFEVTPRDAADGDRPRHLRIENLRERIAPAWQIDLGPWMPAKDKKNARANPAVARLDAWWVDVFPGDPHRLTVAKLESLDLEFAKFDKDVTVDRSKVRIDDIRVEDNFLWVRATHEAGKPIVVRVLGLKKDEQRLQLGELHRWYDTASKYTARFGPIVRDDLDRQVTFQFYTLDSLKKVASHARLDPDKPEPDTSARDLLPRVRAEE
jgi:hypothetical protein